MGFLSSAERQETASKIKQWNEAAINGYNNYINYKKSIEDQLELMKVNEDYTQSDCDEVQLLIDLLNK